MKLDNQSLFLYGHALSKEKRKKDVSRFSDNEFVLKLLTPLVIMTSLS